MKNRTKRNLMLLAIAGIIVIAVLAVAASSQASGAQLFGTGTSPSISPSSATIYVRQSKPFTLNPATNCTWAVGSPTIATIVGSNNGSTVTVVGLAPGTTYVGTTSYCAAGKIRANLSVLLPPTPTPTPDPWASASALNPATVTIHLGEEYNFAVSGMDCNWSSSNSTVLSLYSHGHDQWNNSLATFHAVGTGSAQARAGCIGYISGNGHLYVSTVTVTP